MLAGMDDVVLKAFELAYAMRYRGELYELRPRPNNRDDSHSGIRTSH